MKDNPIVMLASVVYTGLYVFLLIYYIDHEHPIQPPTPPTPRPIRTSLLFTPDESY